MLPTFCKVDHGSAALMHGKLIRFDTEATGGVSFLFGAVCKDPFRYDHGSIDQEPAANIK